MEKPAGTIFIAFYQPCQSLFWHSPFTLLALFALPRQGPLQNTSQLLTHPGCLSWDCYHLRMMSTMSHPGATTSAPRKPILPTPRMGKLVPSTNMAPVLKIMPPSQLYQVQSPPPPVHRVVWQVIADSQVEGQGCLPACMQPLGVDIESIWFWWPEQIANKASEDTFHRQNEGGEDSVANERTKL